MFFLLKFAIRNKKIIQTISIQTNIKLNSKIFFKNGHFIHLNLGLKFCTSVFNGAYKIDFTKLSTLNVIYELKTENYC